MSKTNDRLIKLEKWKDKIENIENTIYVEREKKNIMERIIDFIPIIISVLALIYTIYNVNETYKRQVDPIIYTKSKLSLQRNNYNITTPIINPFLYIKNKNNLDKIYIILPNNDIKRIDVESKKGIDIDSFFDDDLDKNKYIIKYNKFNYKYVFIVTKSIFEDVDIYLLMSKYNSIDENNDTSEINTKLYTEEEIYMLENYDINKSSKIIAKITDTKEKGETDG